MAGVLKEKSDLNAQLDDLKEQKRKLEQNLHESSSTKDSIEKELQLLQRQKVTFLFSFFAFVCFV